MKNKFLAATVAVCALGAGIPVAATAASSHSGGGVNYCSYYSGGVPGKKYCPGTGVGGVPSPPTTSKQAAIDVITVAGDATTISGIGSGHISTTFSSSTFLSDMETLLKETKSASARKVLENAIAVVSAYESSASLTFGSGITFNSRNVRHDLVVYGVPQPKKKGKVVAHKAAKLQKIAFTYKVSHGKVTIKLKQAAESLKFAVNKGALNEPKKDRKLKKIGYKLGLTTTKHKSATFTVSK